MVIAAPNIAMGVSLNALADLIYEQSLIEIQMAALKVRVTITLASSSSFLHVSPTSHSLEMA